MALDDDSELVPLDDETALWLQKLSAVTGDSCADIVASMLKQIRLDDEHMHATTH